MVYSLSSKYSIVFIALTIVLTGCKEKAEEPEPEQLQEELVMYQPSEMANLMNAFYDYNEKLKAAIESESALPEMPESFEKIHTAKMTDVNGRTPIFQSFAPLYLEAQKAVNDSLDYSLVKQRYNATINLCLACHASECVGPIPRIKKLVIQ